MGNILNFIILPRLIGCPAAMERFDQAWQLHRSLMLDNLGKLPDRHESSIFAGLRPRLNSLRFFWRGFNKSI